MGGEKAVVAVVVVVVVVVVCNAAVTQTAIEKLEGE